MSNIGCRIYKEQLDLINQLPEKERALVLYEAISHAFNQIENQNENQIENQNEFAYVSVSVFVYNNLSTISKTVLQLLKKNIICKEFSNNYGGRRLGAGRKAVKEEPKKEPKQEPKKENKEKASFDFVAESFKPVFQKWLDYKREKKQTYKSKLSLQQCYKQLLELSNNNVAIAEKVVNQSIANNWAGLFPLKDISKTTPKIDSPLQKSVDNILEFMLANYEEKGISTNPTLRERYVKKWTPTITDLINACGGDLELAKKMIALYSKKQKGEEWYLWGVLNNFCSLYEELKRGQYVKR